MQHGDRVVAIDGVNVARLANRDLMALVSRRPVLPRLAVDGRRIDLPHRKNGIDPMYGVHNADAETADEKHL